MNHLNGNHARLTHPITSDQVLLRMNQITFAEFLESTHCILGEGAVIERLRRSATWNSTPIWSIRPLSMRMRNARPWRPSVGSTWTLVATTVCRCCCPPRPGGQAGNGSLRPVMPESIVNGDNFRFLDALRKSYGGYAEKVVICGLMSCRGDAYSPADALAVDEALEFHAWQAGEAGRHRGRFPPGRHPSGLQRGNRPCLCPCRHRLSRTSSVSLSARKGPCWMVRR